MKRQFFPTQSAASLVASLVTVAPCVSIADVVSVNFREDNGNPNQLIDPATEAGGGAGVGVTNWNDGLGASGEITDAVDETGAETTLDLAWTCGGTWGDGVANADADAGVGNAQLQRGYLDDNQGSPLQPIDITVTEIPYATYDVVVYFSTDTAGGEYGEFTATDADETVTATTTGIKERWDTNPELDETNSVRVSDLSGDLALNFPVRVGPTRHSVSGIQIIGSSGPPVPLSLGITPSDTDDNLYNFSWVSKDTQVYDLVSSADLTTPPEDWAVWEGQSGISGTGEEITLSNIPSTDSKRFFAIIERAEP